MILIDVTPLFTNIPRETGTTKEPDIQKKTTLDLPRERQCQGQTKCISWIYTHNRIYSSTEGHKRRKGTPMGSPLSCLVVDAVMKQRVAKAFEILRPCLRIR